MTLKLALLGPFTASLDGEPLTDFRNRKTQALLIYLIVEAALNGRSHEQPRERLMDLLWPGLPQPSAQVNLRQTLYQLRQLAPQVVAHHGSESVPLLLSDRQSAWLHPEAIIELDVADFLQDVDGDDLVSLAQAVALYRGDFLADFYLPDSETFEAWAAARREAFRRQAVEALVRLADGHLGQFRYEEAEQYSRRQLAIDNLRESAHRQLMQALAGQGQRSAALAQYDACRDLLRRELDVAPAAETEALFQAIRRGEDGLAGPGGRIRGYELKEKIGEGAYGTVYRAYQPVVARDVAIKVIRAEYANDPHFIRRFEAEAQTVARLEHSRIVPLYDYWREPGGAYLVMRWLRGGSLNEALQAGPWPAERALLLVEQVAAALSQAHRHAVVHRDLKPANILLDEESNAYLGDFGIARHLTGEVTRNEGFAGSPDYVSPEQILSEPVTPQSDIYTFGVVLYELLTGERPFAGESLVGILHKHLNEPLPSVCVRRPELPPAVDEVVQRATAKQPAARYPDALALAAALRLALTYEEVSPELERPLLTSENPYQGLRAFAEADTARFFGRETLVEHLLTRLANPDAEPVTPSSRQAVADQPQPDHPLPPSPSPRFLAVVGPSGSGKSSVVKAGLLPALRQGALPGSEKWFILEMLPGPHPLEEVEAALLRVAVNPPATLLAQLQEDKRGLLRAVKRILPGDAGSELLLVIDQFEELFTLTADPAEARHILDSLVAAVTDPRSRLRIVITLRADFYDRPLLIPGFSELMQQSTEVVPPLTAEELSRAIREPATLAGVTVEDTLLAEMITDVYEQPGALPLLQFALTELFEQRQGNRLTLAAYHEIGGVKGALGRRAEQLYRALDESGQAAARQLFLRLVTLGEGVEDTRRRVLRAELEALNAAGEQGSGGAGENREIANLQSPIAQVVEVFGRSRLLSFDRDPVTRGPTVEVAHEALLREWPRLRGWLEESRDEVRRQRLLAEAAASWQAAGHDGSYLLRGGRLAQFEEWAGRTTVGLTASEQAFLAAGLAARDQRHVAEEARRQRELEAAQQLAETERARAAAEQRRAQEQAQSAGRLRQRAAFLAAALAVAALLAILAFTFARSASHNAELAAAREVDALTNAELAATRAAEAVMSAGLAATREVDAINNAGLAAARQAEAEAEADLRATAEAIAIQEREAAEEQARLAFSRELVASAILNLADDPELIDKTN